MNQLTKGIFIFLNIKNNLFCIVISMFILETILFVKLWVKLIKQATTDDHYCFTCAGSEGGNIALSISLVLKVF